VIERKKRSDKRVRFDLRIMCSALLLALIPACSDAPAKAPTVDSRLARESLVKVLDLWKSGAAIDAPRQGSPPITVQDFDWMQGAKLASYEVQSEGTFDDANLRIPVKLTLATPEGKSGEKTVTYVVGTAPAITVFREMGP
jgi:hypothetical protein